MSTTRQSRTIGISCHEQGRSDWRTATASGESRGVEDRVPVIPFCELAGLALRCVACPRVACPLTLRSARQRCTARPGPGSTIARSTSDSVPTCAGCVSRRCGNMSGTGSQGCRHGMDRRSGGRGRKSPRGLPPSCWPVVCTATLRCASRRSSSKGEGAGRRFSTTSVIYLRR